MPSSAISSKGQVTIPKEIREGLGLKTGDRLNIVDAGPGRILMTAANKGAISTNYRSLRGMIKSPHKRPVTIEKMNEAIARGYAGLR